MKKFSKICLIAVAVLISIGAACSLAAAAFGINSAKVSREITDQVPALAKTQEAGKGETYQKVSVLQISLSMGDVVVETYDGDEIMVDVSRASASVETDGTRLVISDEKSSLQKLAVWDQSTIVVSIPEKKELDEVTIHLNVGEIKISQVDATRWNLNCDVGEIGIEMPDQAERYQGECTCNIGELRYDEEDSSGMSLYHHQDTGTDLDKELNANVNIGEIHIDFQKK